MRLVEKLDGGAVRTKRAVRLAQKPAGSMNPTLGKSDLFAFQATILAMMTVALLRVTGPRLNNSKFTDTGSYRVNKTSASVLHSVEGALNTVTFSHSFQCFRLSFCTFHTPRLTIGI
jgi:hypothetical protein